MPDLYRELLQKATIDIRNPHDVELWTSTLDVYTADLVHAVEIVGNQSIAVLEYLRSNNYPGHRSRE